MAQQTCTWYGIKMTIFIVCELGYWSNTTNHIPRAGSSVRNNVFHGPLKAFRSKKIAQQFIKDEVEKSEGITFHDFDCFEIEVK
jgi:hypothetical protein